MSLPLSACDPAPREVYVPATEPTIELVARASKVDVSVGEPVVLSAERWNGGEWKLVERSKLPPEQCWLTRPPERREPEVADNLRWETSPPNNARLNTNLRADRTREIIFEAPGTYLLQSYSAAWCKGDEPARGRPITILVRSGN